MRKFVHAFFANLLALGLIIDPAIAATSSYKLDTLQPTSLQTPLGDLIQEQALMLRVCNIWNPSNKSAPFFEFRILVDRSINVATRGLSAIWRTIGNLTPDYNPLILGMSGGAIGEGGPAKTTQTSFRIEKELLKKLQHFLIDMEKQMTPFLEEILTAWVNSPKNTSASYEKDKTLAGQTEISQTCQTVVCQIQGIKYVRP